VTHVVFVCTGNICRSPTAHAVLRRRIAERGLGDRLTVDSAGLEAWHAGEPPDARSIQHTPGSAATSSRTCARGPSAAPTSSVPTGCW
jgi:protein-tyrosine phosphatase